MQSAANASILKKGLKRNLKIKYPATASIRIPHHDIRVCYYVKSS